MPVRSVATTGPVVRWLRSRVAVPLIPPGAIERDRLTKRLSRPAPLTVLRAPSGFGKTVAVAQWLAAPAGPEGPAVWLRVDAALDARSFWAELAELLVEAGIFVATAGGVTRRAIETSLRRFAGPVTIVADGIDELCDGQVERQVIDPARYCRNVHLVVCVRSSRHFPSSLQDDIDTTLIESPELAFTIDEIASIPPIADTFPARWAADTHRCMAGWPEPTRAILRALQEDPRQSVDGASLLVARDYLETHVLPAFHDEGWMEFSLATSLPEILDQEVAQHITNDQSAGRRLERLESAGVVTTDRHRGRRVYRWPDAIQNVLRKEYTQRHPDNVAALHQRLAHWYLREDDARSAMRHALHAADTALLVQIVEDSWGTLLHEDPAALDSALAAIPAEAILASPRVAAARDIRMHLLGDVRDATVLTLPDPLPTDERALKSLAGSRGARAALHTASSLMVASRLRGIPHQAVDYACRSEILARYALMRRPAEVRSLVPNVLLQTGITKLVFGDRNAAESILRLAYQTSSDQVSGFVQRDAAGKLALLNAICGDTTRAETWLDRHRTAAASTGALTPAIERTALLARAFIAIDRLRSDELARLLPLIDQESIEERGWRPFVTYLHARRSLIWGDRRGALSLLEYDMDRLAPWLGQNTTMGPLLTAARVELLLSLGLGERARSVLAGTDQHPALQPTAARLALLTGDESAGRLATVHDASHSPNARSELMLIAALARYQQGDMNGATDSLLEALHTARATRSLFPFAMVPRAPLRRVAEAIPEAAALLEAEPLRSTPSPFTGTVTLIELTARERRVLDRIATGSTLQEAAKELFVSYNTIKTQVRSLYAKLGANSRTEALVSAARHGLLPGPASDRT